MAGNEIKYTLRKQEFPFCARDALTKAEELISLPGGNVNQAQVLKQTELAMEIISEFVFSDDKNGYRRELTTLQMLELLLVICDHMICDGSGTEASRNAIFVLLFSGESREQVLGGVVSLGISTRGRPVLAAAAILMQQTGPTSPLVTRLAAYLASHHFLLLPSNASATLDLPAIAPLFTAHFLTATTEIYGFSGKNEDVGPPPKHLLEIIIRWIEDNPTLCISPLLNKLQPVLPQGAIPMPATTPYAGLFRWCILAELSDEVENNLYTKLHRKLLDSVLEAESVKDRTPNVMSAQDLASVASHILQSTNDSNIDRIHKAVDILAQTLQVALKSSMLYGTQQELWKQLKMLPENKLLTNILQENSPLV